MRNARGPKRSFVHSLFVCRHGRDMDTFSHRGFVNSHWEPAIEDEATKKKRPTPFIGISLFRLYLNAGTRESPDRDTREFRIGNKENRYSWYRFIRLFRLTFFSQKFAKMRERKIRGCQDVSSQ